MSDSTVR